MTDILPLFVGGAFHPAQSTAVRERHNPSRPEELVVRAPIGNAADVAAAVAAASDAWPAWRNTSGPVRADALYCWGEAIAARSDELARAIVREVGKPIGEARGEVGRAVVILRGRISNAHPNIVNTRSAFRVQDQFVDMCTTPRV